MPSVTEDNTIARQLVSSAAGATCRLVWLLVNRIVILHTCYVIVTASQPAGSTNVLDDRLWAVNMRHILPSVAHFYTAADSWEALSLSPQQAPADASAAQGCSVLPITPRLTQLVYLIWPRIPIRTSEALARDFPKITVNPRPTFCPEEADQTINLDDQYMQMVAPFWQQETTQVSC